MYNSMVPLWCLVAYLWVAIRSGISPLEFDVRVVEIATSALPVVILIILYVRWIRFSNSAYILMTILPIMHAIGAHYTFANVPSKWLSDLFATDRNMYDRVAHASVWLYTYGICELIDNLKLTKSTIFKVCFSLFAIISLAAVYELFEWNYAISGNKDAGIAVLGSQGDERDAQKDMLMDTIGAIIGIWLYFLSHLWITTKKLKTS